MTETYAVSPQISVADVAALKEAGFTTVICNRPDQEVPPSSQAQAIRAAAEDAGLGFVEIPILPGTWDAERIAQQAATLAEAPGPVLAYCASGTRSTIVWMLGAAHQTPSDVLLSAAQANGYDLRMFRPQLDALYAQSGGTPG